MCHIFPHRRISEYLDSEFRGGRGQLRVPADWSDNHSCTCYIGRDKFTVRGNQASEKRYFTQHPSEDTAAPLPLFRIFHGHSFSVLYILR